MAVNVQRQKVQESFHRQANDYEEHAVVQRRVVERLTAILEGEDARPGRLLDIGAGTGMLLARLRGLYPDALTVGADLAFGMCLATSERVAADGGRVVNADAESLPFATASFDLVVSTSTYQWLTSLDMAFAEVHRVLSPGGLFCFALFGKDTLFELREAYQSAQSGGPERTHRFASADDVLAALQRAGFKDAGARGEMEVEYHPAVPEMLRSLKRIGAATTAPVAAKGLSERRIMLDMMRIYRERYGNDEGIPASYEVIYGIGRK
jgi:malonyl-CoA O-methyltransferase